MISVKLIVVIILKYIFVNPIFMLYTLHLYNAVCQLYLNKTKKRLPLLEYPLVLLFIAEFIIIFSPNLLVFLAALFKPLVSYQHYNPEASELSDLLSRSIS